MKATLKDVAEEAGVSKALVSKFLAGTPDARMRDETRKRIEDAVRKCHYLPSKLARSLKSGRTQTIGLVISELRNAFWSAFADLALREARKHGYRLLISLCDYDRNEELESLRTLAEYRVDGILYCELLSGGELAEQLHREGFPMMLMYQESGLFHSAAIDYRKALGQAVSYLAGRGHSRIFCIHSAHSVWPDILKQECGKTGMALDVCCITPDPAEQLELLRGVCRQTPSAVLLSGWRSTVLFLQVIGREFPEYQPEIVANCHFDHPAFADRRISGLIRNEFEQLICESVRVLIRMIQGEMGMDLRPEAEFVCAGELCKQTPENGPRYFLY